MANNNAPSFVESVSSGISGFFKGLLAGGSIGVGTGGTIGLVVGIVSTIVSGGLFIPTVSAAIGIGAVIGGLLFGSVGSIAGTTTEVVKSRQQIHQVSGQDVANAVNIAFAQGVSVGQTRTLQNPVEAAQESAQFRKMVEDRRIADEAVKHR